MILYRLLLSLAFPLMLARLLLLRLGGRDGAGAFAARLGGGGHRPQGPVIWLHGASNGELASARPVVAELLDRTPELNLLVTANTETGRRLAAGWGHERVIARLAPLDHRLALARFLTRWRPAALIVLENETWPNRLALCARRGIPVFVIGARMSDKSARLWAALPGLARALLGAIRYLSAQDAVSETRFRALGLAPDRIGPEVNLKSTAAGAAPGPSPLPWPRALTLLAASTHEGEEAMVLDAFLAARAARPGLRLILAPRHPHRRDAIEALIAARNLARATRSRGQTANPKTDVYLADTMGEMALWYRAAGLTFVGGSLVRRGGHTPYEPAAAASAILHGPHVANFASAYARLDRDGGAVPVTGADDLAAAVTRLAGTAAAQAALAERATAALAAGAGLRGLDPFYAALAGATGLPLDRLPGVPSAQQSV